MDMLSPPSKPWPNSPCEKGKFYGRADPIHQGHKIVVMSDETWTDFGTLIETFKRTGTVQNDTINKQAAVIAQLTANVRDLQDRLEATRAARKKEKLSWLGLGPKEKK